MQVFFDQEGIGRTLAQYSTEELAPYKIPDDYKSWQKKYYDAEVIMPQIRRAINSFLVS